MRQVHVEKCHALLLRDDSWLCREGCSGSILLSVQYEDCADIDAIESTRAKVGALSLYLSAGGSPDEARAHAARPFVCIRTCVSHAP